MKTVIFGLLLFVCLLVGSAFAQPRIEAIPGTEFNFGRVYKGTKATHSLTIRNGGADTLVITEVSAQCGCTATMISKQRLGPEESANLSISLFTAGYDGRITKHVYVASNDTVTGELEIEFTADVIQSLKPDPTTISFAVRTLDSTYSSTVTLTNSTMESIHILSVKSAFDGLQTRLFKNELMPGEQTDLQVTLAPRRLGSYRGTLQIKTDHTAQPIVEMSILQIYNPR